MDSWKQIFIALRLSVELSELKIKEWRNFECQSFLVIFPQLPTGIWPATPASPTFGGSNVVAGVDQMSLVSHCLSPNLSYPCLQLCDSEWVIHSSDPISPLVKHTHFGDIKIKWASPQKALRIVLSTGDVQKHSVNGKLEVLNDFSTTRELGESRSRPRSESRF